MERQNPFPQLSPLEQVYLHELVEVAARCYTRGWSHGTAGNFSLRGRDGIIWQSPTGICKGDLHPRQFIPLRLEDGSTINPVSAKPSGEMPIHLGIFNAVPEAMTVVHTHPPALVELSRLGKELKFCGDEMQKHLGSRTHLEKTTVPIIKNVLPENMIEMRTEVAKFIKPKVKMVVLAAHGVYAWGKTPMEALSNIEAVEFLCQTNMPK